MRQSPKKIIEGHFNKFNLNVKRENDDLTEQKKEITVDSIDPNNKQFVPQKKWQKKQDKL